MSRASSLVIAFCVIVLNISIIDKLYDTWDKKVNPSVITSKKSLRATDGFKDTKKRKKAQGKNHIDKKHLCLLSGACSAFVKSLNPKAGTTRVTTQ